MNAHSQPKGFPHISAELMAELDKRYPEVIPDVDATPTLEALRLRQGEQRVVRLLRRQFDIQNKTILVKGS